MDDKKPTFSIEDIELIEDDDLPIPNENFEPSFPDGFEETTIM